VTVVTLVIVDCRCCLDRGAPLLLSAPSREVLGDEL
jgi:hypothetical protein